MLAGFTLGILALATTACQFLAAVVIWRFAEELSEHPALSVIQLVHEELNNPKGVVFDKDNDSSHEIGAQDYDEMQFRGVPCTYFGNLLAASIGGWVSTLGVSLELGVLYLSRIEAR
jgi:hypothetical protein